MGWERFRRIGEGSFPSLRSGQALASWSTSGPSLKSTSCASCGSSCPFAPLRGCELLVGPISKMRGAVPLVLPTRGQHGSGSPSPAFPLSLWAPHAARAIHCKGL